MNKPMKLAGGIALAAAVLVVAAVLLFVSRADRYIVGAVESYGEAATGTRVRLGGANASLTEGRATLSRLTVGNPDGFDEPTALEIDDIDLRIELGSVARDVLVINEVLVDGARLYAEQHGERNNLAEMLDRTGSDEPEPTPEDEGRIIIDRFRLAGGRIQLTADQLDSAQSVDLDDVSMQDIGRSAGGITYSEATDVILEAIFAAARTAVRDRLQEAAGDAVRREVEDEVRDRLGEELEDDD